MGFLDNFRKKNAVQINQVNAQAWYPWLLPIKKGDKPIGNFLLQAILNQIWRGISNITFEDMSKGKSLTPEAIVNFIDDNAVLLVNQYNRLGYICVFYNKERKYWIPQDSDIKFDLNGRIINKYAVVLYSPQYQSERSSLYKLSFPIIAEMNKIAGSDSYLTETLGCFGILSGKDMPLTNAEKENLQKGMSEQYGIADDKYKFMITNNPVTFTQVDSKIRELGFQDKIKTLYKYLANLWGVPLPLLFDDASTYNNVKEAKLYFYSNTIRFYAEILLKIARELLTASQEFIPQSTLTYRLENVPELETTLSAACEERGALLDYLLKLREAGMDVDEQLIELYNESHDLLQRV